MSSNLLSGYAVTAVILQQLLTADMIVFRPWTNCPWIVRSGDNLSVETTMETTYGSAILTAAMISVCV